MYTKLTKVITINGEECVSCAFFGTEKCQIHNNDKTHDCMHCKVMGAILNQLHEFEEMIEETDKA